MSTRERRVSQITSKPSFQEKLRKEIRDQSETVIVESTSGSHITIQGASKISFVNDVGATVTLTKNPNSMGWAFGK